MAPKSPQMRDVPENINEEFYQISSEILASFPKFRPPVDLFVFREDICVLAPYCKKGVRLSNPQVEELAAICAEGNLFVARSDHNIYAKHIVKQLDLVLQDKNLSEAEITDLCIRALVSRLADFYSQPVKAFFTPLYEDCMVVTEYIWQDKHRITAFMRRLFRQYTHTGNGSAAGDAALPLNDLLARHGVNTMIVGLWLWLQSTSEYKRNNLDRVTLALLLHDIGMSKVPPFILNKKGNLTTEEREKVILHPLLGVKLMQKMDMVFDEMVQACYEHHERLDGSGYPQKIKGSQLSRMGQLTAVADSFAAMTCHRVYAPGKEHVDAAKELMLDPRYNQGFAKLLFSCFATGSLGSMIDMDKNMQSQD